MKNITVCLDTGKIFWNFSNVIQITTERAWMWYITQTSPMVFCGPWFCLENKKTKHTRIQSFFSLSVWIFTNFFLHVFVWFPISEDHTQFDYAQFTSLICVFQLFHHPRHKNDTKLKKNKFFSSFYECGRHSVLHAQQPVLLDFILQKKLIRKYGLILVLRLHTFCPQYFPLFRPLKLNIRGWGWIQVNKR